MKQVWAFDGFKVFAPTTNHWKDTELWITGIGQKVGAMRLLVFEWSATVTSQGWLVNITLESGNRGSSQGSTFNLPLEIAAAAKRLL